MALSAQTGYIILLTVMLQLKSEINRRKLTMLGVGNTYNKQYKIYIYIQ